MMASRSVCALAALLWTFSVPPFLQASSDIVISQVYGGGGNSGATLQNDFVELFNRGSSGVSVDGWTIQYASSTGSSWDRTNLTGSIQPGRYYLIVLAAGAGGTASLPPGEVTGATNLSATTGKIALVNNATILSGTCPTAVVDFVGYGTANCFEGSPAPALSNTTALIRAANGCTDGDNNSSDFITGAPFPRNATSSANVCGPGTSGGTSGGTTPGTGGGPAITPTIGNAALIFPHFAQGGGYQTGFTFNNLSSTAATVTLTFYSQAGAMTGSNVVTLTGSGSARMAMTGSTLNVGWAKATASPSIDFVGTETIQLFNSAGTLVMEASVLPAQSDTTLRLPVFEKEGFGTGVAFVGSETSGTTVTMTLRDGNGVVANTGSVTLSPAQQTAKFVSELFPGVANFEGMLELTAPRAVAALALRQNFSSGIFSTLPVSPTPTETYFSPKAGVYGRIVQEIEKALNTIDIAIYSFTKDEIADALIAAKARGVQIRILADSSQANGTGSEIARLEAAGIPLKRTDGGGGGILHHKYAIIDGRILVTGSYNWSANAEDNNDENAVFIRDRQVISAFQTNFNSMWSTR